MNKKFLIIIIIFLFVIIGCIFIYEQKPSFNDVLKKLSSSQKIIVKKMEFDSNKYVYYKSITYKTQINNIIDLLSRCSEYNGWRNLSLSVDTFSLSFYDSKDRLIVNAIFDSSGFLNIDYGGHTFYLKTDESSKFNDLLKWILYYSYRKNSNITKITTFFLWGGKMMWNFCIKMAWHWFWYKNDNFDKIIKNGWWYSWWENHLI